MKPAHMKSIFIRIIAVCFLLLFAGVSAGWGERSTMPFNGEIAFHKISLTIPDNYVRDSTQSTENVWVFEKGFYSRHIILSRQDAQNDTGRQLDAYAEYLKEQGMTSERTVFLELEAVRSEGMPGDKMWREMCFAHDGSIYAVAMIGSSEEDMQMLLDTVAVHDEAPEITAQPDDRTPLERFLGYFFGN